jgi:hypothetical protein
MRLFGNDYRNFIVEMILSSVEASTVSKSTYDLVVELTDGYLDQVDTKPLWYNLHTLDNINFAKELFASLVVDFTDYLRELEAKPMLYKVIHHKTYRRLRLAHSELKSLTKTIEIRGQFFCPNYDT